MQQWMKIWLSVENEKEGQENPKSLNPGMQRRAIKRHKSGARGGGKDNLSETPQTTFSCLKLLR